MVETGDSSDQVERITAELAKCRQRGVDDLDLKGANQSPTDVPELERLALKYTEITGNGMSGRVAQIRRLLKDALAAYRVRGNEPDAELIESLFFDQVGGKVESPGERLRRAKAKNGSSDAAFDGRRRSVFFGFAAFLLGFVDSDRTEVALSAPVEPMTTGTNRFKVSRWLLPVSATVALLALVALAIVIWRPWSSATSGDTSGLNGGDAAGGTTQISIGPAPAGIKTWNEQEGTLGSLTVSDPRSPSVTGQRVPVLVQVKVSCKVYAPTFASILPDGYWYRIASAPWSDKWYAPANTFENGDAIGGPTKHNTDFSVPNC